MGFEKLPFNVEVFLFRHILHKVANCMYAGEALDWRLKGWQKGRQSTTPLGWPSDLFIKRQPLQVSALIAFLGSVVSQMGFPLRVSLLPQGRRRWLRKPALGCEECCCCCCCWFHQYKIFTWYRYVYVWSWYLSTSIYMYICLNICMTYTHMYINIHYRYRYRNISGWHWMYTPPDLASCVLGWKMLLPPARCHCCHPAATVNITYKNLSIVSRWKPGVWDDSSCGYAEYPSCRFRLQKRLCSDTKRLIIHMYTCFGLNVWGIHISFDRLFCLTIQLLAWIMIVTRPMLLS